MGIFGAKTPSQPASAGGLSIIATGVTLHGDLDSNGTVKVEGAVEGQLRAERQVLVAKGATVHGDVFAQEAVVGGTVQGAIRAAERVELQSGAVVQGDITTRRIAIAEGATVNGQIRMGEAVVGTRSSSEPEPRRPAGLAPPIMARPSTPLARIAVPPRGPSSTAGLVTGPGDQR